MGGYYSDRPKDTIYCIFADFEKCSMKTREVDGPGVRSGTQI